MNPLTIKSTQGKDIVFDDIFIMVSENRYIESGYCVEIKMIGKLPRCRKSSTLTVRYRIADHIHIGPLFGYGEAHKITAKEFGDIIKTLPVLGYSKLEITPELETFARKQMINLYKKETIND